MGGAKLAERESRPIGAGIPGRWQHRRRRTAAEEARPDPEDPSGSGQRGSQWAVRSWPKGKVGRSVPASLGDGSTGGEELQLKKRGQIRKTCRVARATWQSVGGAKLAEREVGRTASASLGGGSAGDEELQLKKRGQIRKTCQVARATWQSVGGAKLVERESRPISARIPGRWQHRRRRTAAEEARPDPEDPSGPGQTWQSVGGAKLVERESRPIGAGIPGRWQHRRRRTAAEGVRLFPGDPSGGQGKRGSQWAVRSWSKGKVGRSVPASLGDGSTGGEELQLKEYGCFREIRQVARANVAVSGRCEAGRKGKSADQRPYSWAMAAPAAKNCS
ncbi:hypothetical protein [Bacillus velezensis]|uniref:hypothetical protein n=1 Tax=Bacillus velezensis TaxID=492670 RepID=UPI00399C0B7F